MAGKNKLSLTQIKEKLLSKRKEEYQKGYSNLKTVAKSETIDIGNGKLWEQMEKNTAKKGEMKWYKWIFSKKRKLGRFGQKSTENKKLKKMADQMEKEGGQEDYFDPMMAMDSGQEGGIQDEFYHLVTDEANLAQENDYNSQTTEGGMGYSVLAHFYQKRDMLDDAAKLEESYEKEYEQRHDGTTAFVPDGELKEGKADKFAISVGVSGASRFYSEYSKESARQKGISTFLKMFTGKKNVSDEEEEERVAQKVMEKTPLYKKLVAEGKKQNKNYNPKADPLVENLRTEIRFQRASGNPGHAFIRLIPKIGNTKKGSYSFGFFTMGPGKMGGVDEGYVENPDPTASGGQVTEKEYDVPFSGYLKAAAKIRGIKASGRKYSVLGYNCTSFAIEVAKSAGVSIPDKEVAADITTYDHRSERIDIPASLQNFLFKEKLKAKELTTDPKLENSPDKEVYLQRAQKEADTSAEEIVDPAEYEKEKMTEWIGLLDQVPLIRQLYGERKNEDIYEKIIRSMLDVLSRMTEEDQCSYLKEKGIDVNPNDIYPGILIMDLAFKNMDTFYDITDLGIHFPEKSPQDYGRTINNVFTVPEKYNQCIDALMSNFYFIDMGFGQLTPEQARKVANMILDYEVESIDNLASHNSIRFAYKYDESTEVEEAAREYERWSKIIKKEYGSDNIVDYLLGVMEGRDAMRQHLEDRAALFDKISEYL